VSGAGDTVIAALAVMIAAGAGLREAMRIANHAAGIVVGKLGTAVAYPEELISSMRAEQ
jgi:bifunctional ADP-heptose synthase (sugar kinase/adenylyltransferase)